MTTSNYLSSCKYQVFISFGDADTRNNFADHLYGALRSKKIPVYKDDVALRRGFITLSHSSRCKATLFSASNTNDPSSNDLSSCGDSFTIDDSRIDMLKEVQPIVFEAVENLRSSSNDLNSCKYDVFISFRGTDTRNNFTGHLYGALHRKKIQVYKDDVTLLRGDEISPALYKAIEDSRISIVVFSENYAMSRWCLDELVHILKCKREKGQLVLPVFYKVDPSHVRNQQESYAKAFVDHEMRFKDDMEKLLLWRSALEEAGNHSGWDSREYRSESELVEKIAQATLLRLNNISATTGGELRSNLVGIEKHVAKIVSMLCFDSQDDQIIGIWGMGGIGKTTLAEVVEKRFSSEFESCFFEDVSNKVKTLGSRRLVKEFFGTLLDEKDVDMNNSMKDERLRRKKVFVVLDNVDELEQLECLIGASELMKSRFGKGSRIIITSRNKKLLEEATNDIYKVESLCFDEALDLFYRNAFRRDPSKITDFIKLSKEVVDYTGGNPLALKVLGSYLHARSIKEWESALIQLRKAPNEKVQKVLKISFDALDHVEQSIFLDIGCFFKGENREKVEEILGEESHIGINVLIEKCLLTIDGGQIRMHDLIQEMVWEIVRRESADLGQRSRLWNTEDTFSIMEKNKGSARNEGISLETAKMSEDLYLQPTVFEAMKCLKIIKIGQQHTLWTKYRLIPFDQGLEHLPDSLRYLYWTHYPLESLPHKFEPQNLVRLEMPYSKLKKLWDGVKRLENLKYIDLHLSENLIELPDLFQAPKLEHLDLSFCFRLRCIPKINGNLKYLSLRECKNLESLPDLPSSLQHLYLSGCQNLGSLPDLIPSSLQHLHISECQNLESLPDLIPSSLQYINISFCKNLKSLPDLPSSLQRLNLSHCNNLKSLPHLPSSLQHLDIGECENLENLPDFPSSLRLTNKLARLFTRKAL